MSEDQSDIRINNVMKELDNIKNRQVDFMNSLIIFIATITLFFATGLFKNTILDIVLLIAIMLIHELGHFAGMKLYKYKNVQIFFIPFLGAATSGSEYIQNGTQKAIVALMGPFPGILIGASSFILFHFFSFNKIFYDYAMASLIINGFNLLPIYPLDGGHFLNEIIFSKSKYIELFFNLSTCIILIWISISFGEWVISIFAFFILFTIPNSFRASKITDSFKKDNLVNDYAYGNTIPKQFIKTTFKYIKNYRSKSTKALANIINNSWKKAFTVPPKIAKAIILFISYLLVIFVALIIVTVFTQPKCVEGNCANGRGVMEYPTREKYIGEFRNGLRHGAGIMQWDNGEIYRGEWSNNQRNGKGSLTKMDGSAIGGIWAGDKLIKQLNN